MKKIWSVLALSSLVWLCGCNKTDEDKSIPIADDEGDIILRERDPDYPLTDYVAERLTNRLNIVGDIYFGNMVGRSFKVADYPLESLKNIGIRVIDIDKYSDDYPDAYYSVPIKESRSTSFSFYGFDRYETKSQVKDVIKDGYQINCLLFKIGTERTYSKVFTEESSSEAEYIYGEMNIKFCDRKYELFMPEYLKNEILYKYLSPGFVKFTYYYTPKEFIDSFGAFILTKFISGGKVTGLFRGKRKYSQYIEKTVLEKNMNTEMSVCISEKSSDGNDSESISSNLSIGKSTQKFVSETNQFRKIEFSINTVGGLPVYANFTDARELCAPTVDLSTWCNSLSNESNLAIAELPAGCLIPITEAIEEDNLKEILYEYYKTGTCVWPLTKFEEPKIYLSKKILQEGTQYYTHLVTRYGEDVLIRTRYLPDNNDYDRYYSEERQRVGALFPHLAIHARNSLAVIYPQSFQEADRSEFDVDFMRRYVDPLTGKTYLLTHDDVSGELIGYTLFDSRIINDYGLAELIASLPEADVSGVAEIRKKYRLIAL